MAEDGQQSSWPTPSLRACARTAAPLRRRHLAQLAARMAGLAIARRFLRQRSDGAPRVAVPFIDVWAVGNDHVVREQWQDQANNLVGLPASRRQRLIRWDAAQRRRPPRSGCCSPRWPPPLPPRRPLQSRGSNSRCAGPLGRPHYRCGRHERGASGVGCSAVSRGRLDCSLASAVYMVDATNRQVDPTCAAIRPARRATT